MRFQHLTLAALLSSSPMLAIAEPLAFTEENWAFIMGAEVVEHAGKQALRLGIPAEGAPFGFGLAVAKVAPFTNGTIEYEVDFGEGRIFAGSRLRIQGQGDFEDFYLRGHQSGNPDASQYMGQYNGIPSWQLYSGPNNSAAAEFNEGWNKVKLVVSGDLMDVFINDMEVPAFTTVLKREGQTGGLALWGFGIGAQAWFANYEVHPEDAPEIIGTPTPEAAATPGTVLQWQVSGTFEGSTQTGSSEGLDFTPIDTWDSGMLDLARVQGIAEGEDTAYARVVVLSDIAQSKAFEFGFSDEATVYLNGEVLFTGRDLRASRDYRFLGTVGYYDTVYLNLVEGENELLIAVSESVEDKTGWAVQGRFADMEGISLE